MTTDPKVVWHQASVSSQQRAEKLGQRGCVIWFTGLSGSGKSTIANAVDQLLVARGAHSYLLDGDNIRHGLCATPQMLSPIHGEAFAHRFGLGFSSEDREENIRRVGAVTQLLASAGLICLTAFVSPYRRDRDRVRNWVTKQDQSQESTPFFEVFVNTSLEVCMQRDPKGLYQQALAGKIPNFTGISDPYEAPLAPELELQGGTATPIELAEQVLKMLQKRGIVSGP